MHDELSPISRVRVTIEREDGSVATHRVEATEPDVVLDVSMSRGVREIDLDGWVGRELTDVGEYWLTMSGHLTSRQET